MFEANEFMKRRIQILNREGVLRVREMRKKFLAGFPFVADDENDFAQGVMNDAKQIDVNLIFLLDMFDVDPLPLSKVVSSPTPTPKGIA